MTPPYAPPGLPEHGLEIPTSYLDELSDFLTSDKGLLFTANLAKFTEEREITYRLRKRRWV